MTELEWAKEDAPQPMPWAEACAYAASLGNGWRLPTRVELCARFDADRGSSVGMVEDWYWSGTQPPWVDGRAAWLVNFYGGSSYSSVITHTGRVRCVR